MTPFLSDVVPSTGPLAGQSLSDAGIMLQKKGKSEKGGTSKDDDDEEKPSDVSPNKPTEDVSGDKPADKKLAEGWSEEGEFPNGIHQDKEKDLFYIWLNEKTPLTQGFIVKFRYYPGNDPAKKINLTTDRIRELNKTASCEQYFYTFLQVFNPYVLINGKEAVQSTDNPPTFEYVDQGSGGDKTPVTFYYDINKWNIDSRNKDDGVWEYAGTERGAGNVQKVLPAYTQDADWVKPGNAAYWFNRTTQGIEWKDVTSVSVEVKYESYVLLCCYSDKTIPYRPPRPGVKGAASDASKISPIALIGYQTWQYDYTWTKDANAFKFSRAYPFSKWKWQRSSTGEGWEFITNLFPKLKDIKFVSK